jgi:hypothetical protein
VIVLAGDFYQFPPITGSALWMQNSRQIITQPIDQSKETDVHTDGDLRVKLHKTKDSKERSSILTIRGQQIWMNMESVIFLDEQMRQAGDHQWATFLHKHRYTPISFQDYASLTESSEPFSFEPASVNPAKLIAPSNKFRHHANMAAVLQYGNDKKLPVYLFIASHQDFQGVQLENILSVGDNSNDSKGPGIFPYCKGIPLVINENICTSIGLVNGKECTAWDVHFEPDTTITKIGADIYIARYLIC